jgi:hypothetical protein
MIMIQKCRRPVKRWKYGVLFVAVSFVLCVVANAATWEHTPSSISYSDAVWFVDNFPIPVREVVPLCNSTEAHFCAVKCVPEEKYVVVRLCCRKGRWLVGPDNTETLQLRHRNLMCGGFSQRGHAKWWSLSEKEKKDWVYMSMVSSSQCDTHIYSPCF